MSDVAATFRQPCQNNCRGCRAKSGPAYVAGTDARPAISYQMTFGFNKDGSTYYYMKLVHPKKVPA